MSHGRRWSRWGQTQQESPSPSLPSGRARKGEEEQGGWEQGQPVQDPPLPRRVERGCREAEVGPAIPPPRIPGFPRSRGGRPGSWVWLHGLHSLAGRRRPSPTRDSVPRLPEASALLSSGNAHRALDSSTGEGI